MLSPQELAAITAAVPVIVGYVSSFLTPGDKAKYLRPLSAAVGILGALLAYLGNPGSHTLAGVETVAGVGFGIGTGVTFAVATVKAAPATIKSLPRPSVSLQRQQPATPAVEVTTPAS